MESRIYTLEKDGKSVKLKPSQLSTGVLARIFGLFPDSILLVSDDGFVETPSDDGTFETIDDLPVWSVTGESMKPAQPSSLAVTTPHPQKCCSDKWAKKVEISEWSESEGAWMTALTLPIYLTDETANVKDVSMIVGAEVFGGEQAVLLNSEYQKVPDTKTSTGICVSVCVRG